MKDQINVKNNKRKDNVKTEDSVKTEDGEIIDDVHRRYSPCASKVDRGHTKAGDNVVFP